MNGIANSGSATHSLQPSRAGPREAIEAQGGHMEALHFIEGRAPIPLDPALPMPQDGFIWLDIVRGEDHAWRETVERLAGIELYEHVNHPSHYDGTSDYEVLLFRSLAPEQADEVIPTRGLGLLLTGRLLVTVHEPGSVSIATVRDRLLSGVGRVPLRPVGPDAPAAQHRGRPLPGQARAAQRAARAVAGGAAEPQESVRGLAVGAAVWLEAA
jgi:hypothetical protein